MDGVADWNKATPTATSGSFPQAYVATRIDGSAPDGSEDVFAQVKLQDIVSQAPGPSAYETWLALGNTGTQQDFINSLKGESGVGQTISNYGTWAP